MKRYSLIKSILKQWAFFVFLTFNLVSCNRFEPTGTTSEGHVSELPKFDYGTISGDTYCNDFFKFRISVCEEYRLHLQEQDTITQKIEPFEGEEQLLLYIEPELVPIDFEQVLNQTKSMDDWSAYKNQKRKYDFYGAEFQLIISAYRLGNSSLKDYVNRFSNIHPKDFKRHQTEMTVLDGKHFWVYEGIETQPDVPSRVMYRMLGGQNKQITCYITERNGYALSIDLFYKNQGQQQILTELLQTLAFH